MSKKIQVIEPEIIDYDTDYLDAVDGSVVDLPAPSAARQAGYPLVHTACLCDARRQATHTGDHAAITRHSRGNLVLPTPTQPAGNLPAALHLAQAGQFPSAIGDMMVVGNQFAGQLMSKDPYGRSTQTDSAITIARASLMYSSAHMAAIAVITAALLMLAYPLIGGELTIYLLVGLLLWGAAGLGALLWNRAQGLHHSATGIAHADISARERVALHAIDKNHETFANVLDRVYGGKK